MRQPTTRINTLILCLGGVFALILAGASAQAAEPIHKAARHGTKSSKSVSPSKAGKRVTAKKTEDGDAEREEKGRKKRLLSADRNEEERESGRGDYEHVIERFRMLHAGANGKVNWAQIAAERAKAATIPAAQIGGGRNKSAPGVRALTVSPQAIGQQNPTWQFIGPQNLQGGNAPSHLFMGPGAVSGRVSAVSFDFANTSTMYCAGATGGVWKSVNAGQTWTVTTDAQPNIAISSLVLDPNNHNVIYAGTGDYDGGSGSGTGILRSLDGGQSWTTIGAILGSGSVKGLLVDPSSKDPVSGRSNIIMAAVGRTGSNGIWRTTNAGLTWTKVITPQLHNLLPPGFPPFLVPGDGRTLFYNSNRTAVYAAVDGDGIYKSTNNGVTWTLLAGNTFFGQLGGVIFFQGLVNVEVAASKLDPNTVYVADDNMQKIFKSTNGGQAWTWLPAPPTVNQWGQSFYDFWLNTSAATTVSNTPAGPVSKTQDAVYAGLFSVYMSPDAGKTWLDATASFVDPTLAHTDQHSFAVNPTNQNDVLIGNDGGIYRSIFAPSINGFRFTSLNRTLGITQFYGAGISPIDDGQMLGGTQDNSTPHADGSVFNWLNPGIGDGINSAINQSDPLNPSFALRGPQNQYLSSQGNNVEVTENDWATKLFIPVPVGGPPEAPQFFTPLTLNAGNQLLAYSASNLKVYQYTHPALGAVNTNTAWTAFGQMFNFPMIVEGAPYEAGAIFVGDGGGGLWISADAGSNFTAVDGGNFGGPVTSIVVSQIPIPVNGPVDGFIHKVWVALGGGGVATRVWAGEIAVFDNGNHIVGFQWTPLNNTNLPDLPIFTMVQLNHDDELSMFVGNDLGVYSTVDGGNSWQDAGLPLGLPRVTVNQLRFAPSTGFLNAFTYGRGVWRLQVGNITPINIYPNLEQYKGDRSKLSATVTLFFPGSQTPVEFHTIKLSASGWINLNISHTGFFDMRVAVTGFLSRRIPNFTTGQGTFITPLIFNGDVDRNNAVTQGDLTRAQAKLGQFTTGPEDVDGDGRVTSADINIITNNIGKVGN
jgi:hypothetical protein